MRKFLMPVILLSGWLHASTGSAQPPGSNFLPRAGGGYAGNQQGSPFNNSAFNSYNAYSNFNNGFGQNGFNNIYGPLNPAYGGGAGFPFAAAPWQANPWAGGAFANPYVFGGNFQGNFGGAGAPFSGYQTYGYGNYAPIVGLNNGWWPYQPAYNPNNPINQYFTNLYMQGLPNLNNLPGNAVLPR